MPYLTMKKAFHKPDVNETALLEERLASEDSVILPFEIGGSQAFFMATTDIYRFILQAERLDKEIASIRSGLPNKAIEHYMNNCLIDEIVLTNEIEGVYSTRREIGKVLEALEKNDRFGRFYGIVSKYLMLIEREEIPVSTCADIRAIYDDLVLREVAANDEKDVPDGKYFRKKGVSVCDAAQREIHHGIEPESKIIELMEHGLSVLNDDSIELLPRVSVFHFLFGYIHPFYDGNGRISRFISSYALSRGYDPLVAFRLSYSIKKDIQSYYKGFQTCEHPLNKGDLTPFVLMFSKILVDAMESMRDSLASRKERLAEYLEKIRYIPSIDDDGKLADFASVLIQASLFAELGITTKELCATFSLSKPTVYKKLKAFKDLGLLMSVREGHEVYYKLDVNNLHMLDEAVEKA